MSDNANNQRQLRLGAILQRRIPGNMSAWRHPDATADASINLPEFNIASGEKSRTGEIRFRVCRRWVICQRKIHSHFLNRFEPLTLLAAGRRHTIKSAW